MKRFIAFLLCLIIVCGAFPVVAHATEKGETFDAVIEINSWEEFEAAFENLPQYACGNYKMVLMKDLSMNTVNRKPVMYTRAWVSVWIYGNNVEFDFNGHTLSCVDDISNTTSNFIEICVRQYDLNTGSTLRFTDSVGGGGISMVSPREKESEIAAIVVRDDGQYKGEDDISVVKESHNQLVINGGNYTLETSTQKPGGSTLTRGINYRGTFIADDIDTFINGGCFEARGSGYTKNGVDYCVRELTAFGTFHSNKSLRDPQSLVINSGKFKSPGFSVHHFDEGVNNINEYTGSLEKQIIPEIYGGAFSGGIGFIGHTFAYYEPVSDSSIIGTIGFSKLAELQAIKMIKNQSAVAILTRENTFIKVTEATFEDLHNAAEILVMNESMLNLEFSPLASVGDNTVLYCPIDKSVTFSVSFKTSDFVREHVNYSVYIGSFYVRAKGETEWTEYTHHLEGKQSFERTFNAEDYPSGFEVMSEYKIFVARQEFKFHRLYTVNVTEKSGPATIITPPQSAKVGLYELASTTVEASNVDAYQWQVQIGDSWVNVDDTVATMFDNVRMYGYKSPWFSVYSESLGSIKARCQLTSTDGTTTKTGTVTLTFGDVPQVKNFYSGGYYEGGEAKFYLLGDMFERVTWSVMYRGGGTTKFYTLDEFKAETGIDYYTSFKLFGSTYRAVVTFKNVPESMSRSNYSVGYTVENTLGNVSTGIDNTLPFTLLEEKPMVTEELVGNNCIEGETLTFTFTSPDMSGADWSFETYDEDGIGIVHDLDKMKAAFPKSTFETETKDGIATLTITNADTAMNGYTLFAYAVGEKGTACAGRIDVSVLEEEMTYELGDVNGDGKVNNLDASAILKYDAGINDLTEEQKEAANVNGDGKVNNLDASAILKYDAGIINGFN